MLSDGWQRENEATEVLLVAMATSVLSVTREHVAMPEERENVATLDKCKIISLGGFGRS